MDYISIEYIDKNECHHWTRTSALEYGIKGMVANDLAYDYDKVTVKKLRTYINEEFDYSIRTYLVTVKQYDEPWHFIMKVHDNSWGLSVYYVKL